LLASSSLRTAAGLRPKKCWRVRVGLKCVGREQARFLKFLWVRTKNFNPHRTLVSIDVHMGL